MFFEHMAVLKGTDTIGTNQLDSRKSSDGRDRALPTTALEAERNKGRHSGPRKKAGSAAGRRGSGQSIRPASFVVPNLYPQIHRGEAVASA